MAPSPSVDDLGSPERLVASSAPAKLRELERELASAREEAQRLRAELDRANQALETARREVQSASDAKDRFLSSISHELRTPLSAIVLWTSLIEDQKIVDPTQLREALDSIKRSAEEQRQLIEDLVDTSRVLSGKLRLDRREFEIAAAVHNGVDTAQETARSKGIVITENLASDAGVYHGDPRRIQQLVGHLVQNAVKFTPPSGRVTVDLRRVGPELILSVSDTGIGLAPENLQNVFERFVQVEHTRVRTESGMGLGLAISRQIAELHGGTIRAESPGVGRGATFIVQLPIAHDPHGGIRVGGEKPRLQGLLTGRRILLIEDAQATRRALTLVLTEAGADVVAVDSAPAAWESLDRLRPDLIVSDLGLPTIDGFTLLRQIRDTEETNGTPPIPAIAVTAFAGDDICQQALESGFQTCLAKPVEPMQLVATLAALSPATS